ncbi:unnamed protein product [Effrenium voratum]|nr:unnamed protein product [Effrenium voratum]
MRWLALDLALAAGFWAPGAPPYGLRCLSGSPPLAFYEEKVPFNAPRPRVCAGARFLPVSFAIPKEDVVPCVPEKLEDFASLIPGKEESYVFPMTAFGEMEYKRMYRQARFAVKKRRAGWETMRIYEILSCGSVPYIQAAEEIPDTALVFVNKTLLRAARHFEGLVPEEFRLAHTEGYATLAAELLRHTQQHLTTEALARYILGASGKKITKALFVAGCYHGDYLCYVSLHGLRRLLGSGLVDFPVLDYMYTPKVQPMQPINRRTVCPQTQCTVLSGGLGEGGEPRFSMSGLGGPVAVYGGGFSYGYRLEHLPLNRSRLAINRQVARHEFDVVIIPNPYLALGEGSREVQQLVKYVLKHYPPEDIIILDGRDPEKDDVLPQGAKELSLRGFIYFLREVPGATSCPGSVCLEECSGNATSGGETAAEPFPLLLVYIPASVVAVLLLCCGILCWRLVRRSCRVPELSLPTVQLRRQVPPPADPLARQLQEATERALQAPIEDKDVVPKSFSVLDPTRKEFTRVGKLLEEWEEEEHRFLHINNEEQALFPARKV